MLSRGTSDCFASRSPLTYDTCCSFSGTPDFLNDRQWMPSLEPSSQFWTHAELLVYSSLLRDHVRDHARGDDETDRRDREHGRGAPEEVREGGTQAQNRLREDGGEVPRARLHEALEGRAPPRERTGGADVRTHDPER